MTAATVGMLRRVDELMANNAVANRGQRRVFVDTNVLIYAEDGRDEAKQQRAREWLAKLWQLRCGVLSVQVFNEFYVNVTGKLRPPLGVQDAKTVIRRFSGWQLAPQDMATIESAWAIEARYQVSHWDGLVLAAAQHAGCSIILSEDMQHVQKVGALTVLNPFLTSPSDYFDQL